MARNQKPETANAALPATAPDPFAAAREAVVKQGSDLDKVKKALEDATSLARNLWISFITFGTYLVITISGVTHKQLFFATPIELPVLKAGLPLVTFFWVAPILFVIFHLYLLLNLKLLADQVHGYSTMMMESRADAAAIERARLQLPNFIIVQILAGTATQRSSAAGALLAFTSLLTLVIAPTILILFAQLKFLPYHSQAVTNAQRLALLVDMVLVWYFWVKIKGQKPDRWIARAAMTASAAAIYFSTFVLIFPGERPYARVTRALFVESGASDSDDSGRFYNTLVLPDFRVVDPELLVKIKKSETGISLSPGFGERSIDLRNRDFRNADFTRIDLQRADLREAILDGAELEDASLQGAWFDLASLKGTSLDRATLQGASLDQVSLQGASLDGASLQGASLVFASLQGASLENASLQGAALVNASLQGASLDGASLQGASLENASLQGASLERASLQGASLKKASLQGALLSGASLQGTSLEGAIVWRNSIRSRSIFLMFFSGSYWSSRWYDSLLVELRTSMNPIGIHDDDFGMTTQSYQALVETALSGVPEDRVDTVKKRLHVLDPTITPNPTITSNPAIFAPDRMINWPRAENHAVPIAVYQSSLAATLYEIVCDRKNAPFVARGILRDINKNDTLIRKARDIWSSIISDLGLKDPGPYGSRLRDASHASLDLIEKMLDPDKQKCRGANGLSEAEFEGVQELKINLENKR